MTVPLRFRGRITSAPVSRQADQWFVSVVVEMVTSAPLVRPEAGVGVDLGCTNLATDLTRRFTTIGIEDLSVVGMRKNHALARGIMDQSFGEFRRQLEYQARLTGTVVVVADRWYPSSKVCSGCGHRLQALARSQRRWRCPRCGVDHDRDLNAAKNLEQMAVWSTVSAGGEVGSGGAAVGFVKPASTKQEVSSRALPGSDSLCTAAQAIS